MSKASARDWPSAQLQTITTKIGSGATPRGGKKSYKDSGIALIRSLNVYDFEFRSEGLAFIDEEQAQGLSNVEVQSGDILLNITGASVARCCLVPRDVLPARVNQHVAIVRVDPGVAFSRYVLYCINSPRYKTHLLTLAQGGATREALTKSTIGSFGIPLPPLPTQHKIGTILSAYDDLIENNTRRIAILEEMAQAIYREWFVHFRFPGHEQVEMVDSELGPIPEGWEVKELGEVSLNFDRKRVPLSSLQRAGIKGEYPYYGAAKILDYINDYIFDGVYLLVAEDGSVITEDRKPVLQIATGKFWVNNHAHVLQGKEPVSTYFLYLCLSNFDISGHVTGAAQPKVNQANLNRIPVLVPSAPLLERVGDMVEDLFSHIDILKRKNEVLRRTRDLLLPRLISGEVDVSELEINTGGLDQ